MVQKNDKRYLRLLDIFLSVIGLTVFLPVMLILFLIGLFDTGAPIFIQQRVGRDKLPFKLIKFRTMQIHTTHTASHLADKSSITPLGHFLRRSKLDELPQLWNVLCGDMSLVGPRPCLYSQSELIDERERRGIFDVRPGITGLAQVNGIDMSTPCLLAETDAQMITNLSVKTYFSYLLQTLTGRGAGDRVR